MWIGVAQAGYSAQEACPILLLIFRRAQRSWRNGSFF